MVFATTTPALACSCVGFVDALEFQNDFAAVFVGEVVDQRLGPTGQFGDRELELTFEIETLYKGNLTSRALLYSYEDSGANCGFNARGTAAILAYVGEDQRLRTDGCSAAPLGNDGVVRDALEARFGQGAVPPPPDPDIVPVTGFEQGGPPPLLYGGALFVVVLGVGLGLALREDRSTV
jgi:hypothetical protein